MVLAQVVEWLSIDHMIGSIFGMNYSWTYDHSLLYVWMSDVNENK